MLLELFWEKALCYLLICYANLNMNLTTIIVRNLLHVPMCNTSLTTIKILSQISISGIICYRNKYSVFCKSKMANAHEFVNNAIKSKKLVVFSKTTCPYCTEAKECLSQYVPNTVSANEYEVIEINKRSDCNEIQSYFQQLTGARTVNCLLIFFIKT